MTEAMNILDGTEAFMRAGGQLEDDPIMSENFEDPLRELRRNLLREEYWEYRDGEAMDEPVETADGLLDVIVIAWGTLLAYFGPELAKKMAQSVTDSNLSKILPDGTVLKRDDGKILKPEGYVKPDIRGILHEAGYPRVDAKPGGES